jgi:phytanoyl-CoA hydroxylase
MHATASPACPPVLGIDELQQFDRDGFLAYEQVLSTAEVIQARQAISDLVQQAYARNRVAVFGEGLAVDRDGLQGRDRFYVQCEAGTNRSELTAANCEEQVRKVVWFVDEHPFFHYLIHEHPKVRRIASTLCHPGYVTFQEMMLIKPAHIGSARVWHQDCAYFAVKPLTAVLGMWIAIDDADSENGCMHLIPGAHAHGPLLQSSNVGCTIPDDRLDLTRVVPIPLRAGGAMFFNGLLPHMTPANRSPLRRRAIQFHVRHPESEICTREEYATIFAERDGTPAACSSWQYRR